MPRCAIAEFRAEAAAPKQPRSLRAEGVRQPAVDSETANAINDA